MDATGCWTGASASGCSSAGVILPLPFEQHVLAAQPGGMVHGGHNMFCSAALAPRACDPFLRSAGTRHHLAAAAPYSAALQPCDYPVQQQQHAAYSAAAELRGSEGTSLSSSYGSAFGVGGYPGQAAVVQPLPPCQGTAPAPQLAQSQPQPWQPVLQPRPDSLDSYLFGGCLAASGQQAEAVAAAVAQQAQQQQVQLPERQPRRRRPSARRSLLGKFDAAAACALDLSPLGSGGSTDSESECRGRAPPGRVRGPRHRTREPVVPPSGAAAPQPSPPATPLPFHQATRRCT